MQENGVCGVIIITRGAGGCRRGGFRWFEADI